MILKDLLSHFNIKVSLPEYLYEETFNEVFLKGELSKEGNIYKIVIETQKDVTHTMIIDQTSDYPITISSLLPNGRTNGTKFGQSKGDLKFI